MAHHPTVLVSGAIANKHLNGGEAWVRLNWLLGLRRLGCLVYFVEQIRSDTCVDEAGAPAPFEQSANLRFFTDVVDQFDLRQASSLICDDGAKTCGLSYREVLDVAAAADVLINISGHLMLEPILRRVRRKAYIDLDPGFTQCWHAQGMLGAHLDGHDFFFTVGENIGTAECPIPTDGLTWRRKRRFLVLDEWPVCGDGDRNRFTTVAAWRGAFGPVEHAGRRYGLKVHEFRKFISLPQRAPQIFEIALSIHPSDRADLEALRAGGWRIVDPREAARDPVAFRRYVQGSGGEFSAAQGIYVDTGSGWLSDRTVRYLASGKPCLVQDTGFSRNYPVGDGLVPFRTLEEAVAGAGRIARDYEGHSRAARELAVMYFDSDKVLPDMLDQMGIQL
jgi:hypothetical protein